ncbi:MAG: bifunctional folylpolyglutamate synthase/dihydrofolate synthase [Myxococcota bacterium]
MGARPTLRTLGDAESYLSELVNLERVQGFDYETLGLARIEALLEAVGRPERELRAIHIAGSKGKGSVALATECLLRAAGRRVGTYTSPHLESWRERFRVDGAPVRPERLVGALERLRPGVERQRRDPQRCPSFFDVSTALAFLLFRDAGVDAAVVEVGLGGRLDSTNVLHPRVTVVTSIELEHTDKLGTTLGAIATEKAGILEPGTPALHGRLPVEAWAALAARAVALDVDLEEVAEREASAGPDALRVTLADGRELQAPLLGAHQARNLALAVRASEHFLGRALRARELGALGRLELPARLERVGGLILDVAHTPGSARALRETLEGLWPERRWVLVLSLSRDKDAAAILKELAGPTRRAFLSVGEPARALDSGVLEALAWAQGIGEVEIEAVPARALAAARRAQGPEDLIVVAGSVYLAGAIRARLRAEGRIPGPSL